MTAEDSSTQKQQRDRGEHRKDKGKDKKRPREGSDGQQHHHSTPAPHHQQQQHRQQSSQQQRQHAHPPRFEHKGNKKPKHQHQHPKGHHQGHHSGAAAAALPFQGGVAPTPVKGGRHYTVSIAVAGSILVNAQSPELRTYLVGEIARAAAIFQVDEMVVYGDESARGGGGGSPGWGDPNLFFARLLQYVEMPQYLRKALLPHHPDLRLAGILNPLDAPHHPRLHERLAYREGVTLETPAPATATANNSGKDGGSLVNVGLRKPIHLDRRLKAGVRVTVKLDPRHDPPSRGVAVAPSAPREEAGLYWGYSTRVAKNLAEVFSGCPFKGGSYDLTIGTSERGHQTIDDPGFALPPFRHLLLVFGGVAGLEAYVDASEEMRVPAAKTHTLFDVWLNVCPEQGSRTIRTEEAVPITLARLRPLIVKSGATTKATASASASASAATAATAASAADK